MFIPEIIQKGSIIKSDIKGIKLQIEFKNNQIINILNNKYNIILESLNSLLEGHKMLFNGIIYVILTIRQEDISKVTKYINSLDLTFENLILNILQNKDYKYLQILIEEPNLNKEKIFNEQKCITCKYFPDLYKVPFTGLKRDVQRFNLEGMSIYWNDLYLLNGIYLNNDFISLDTFSNKVNDENISYKINQNNISFYIERNKSLIPISIESLLFYNTSKTAQTYLFNNKFLIHQNLCQKIQKIISNLEIDINQTIQLIQGNFQIIN